MKHYSSLILGHETMDINTDHIGNTVRQAGGAVLYSSASAYSLGHSVGVITKVAKCDRDRLSAFTIPKEDIHCLDSSCSTDMINRYFTADKEKRSCVCASQGDKISAEDIPCDISADIYHLAGLVYGDYSDDLIEQLSEKGSVAVDVQGYLRHVDRANGGNMYFEDWKDKKEKLKYITYLKTDAAEAEILTGLPDREQAARLLHSWGAKEVLITHNTEVLVFDGNRVYTCPIKARNLSGRTGRGDTTFAAYINERLEHGIESALLTATAAVSLKMEQPGPFTKSRKDVEDFIKLCY